MSVFHTFTGICFTSGDAISWVSSLHSSILSEPHLSTIIFLFLFLPFCYIYYNFRFLILKTNIFLAVVIRHNTIEIRRCMTSPNTELVILAKVLCNKEGNNPQIGNIKIDQFRRDIVVQRILHIDLIN